MHKFEIRIADLFIHPYTIFKLSANVMNVQTYVTWRIGASYDNRISFIHMNLKSNN